MCKSRGAHAAHEIHDGDIVVLRAEEGEDLPLPPPPPELVPGPAPDLVTALYQFEVMAEGNIEMAEGEEFYRLGEDEEGWVKVRRLDGSEEG